MACIHGNNPSDCLICDALGISPAATATASRSKRRGGRGRAGNVEVVPPGTRPKTDGGSRLGVHAATLIGLLVLAAISFWVVTSLVFAILRLVELAIVAGVAGTLGYRVGRARGRRER